MRHSLRSKRTSSNSPPGDLPKTEVKILTDIFGDIGSSMIDTNSTSYRCINRYQRVIGLLLTEEKTSAWAMEFLTLDDLTPLALEGGTYSGPMPLGLKSIQIKLYKRGYESDEEFSCEVYRMFETCLNKFSPGDRRIDMARELRSAFTQELEKSDRKIFLFDFKSSSRRLIKYPPRFGNGMVDVFSENDEWLKAETGLTTPADRKDFQNFLNSKFQHILTYILSKEDMKRHTSPFLRLEDTESTRPELLNFCQAHSYSKGPMDFSKIQTNIFKSEYKLPEHFFVDMRMMFRNCVNYFQPNHRMVFAAKKLNMFFWITYQKEWLMGLSKCEEFEPQKIRTIKMENDKRESETRKVANRSGSESIDKNAKTSADKSDNEVGRMLKKIKLERKAPPAEPQHNRKETPKNYETENELRKEQVGDVKITDTGIEIHTDLKTPETEITKASNTESDKKDVDNPVVQKPPFTQETGDDGNPKPKSDDEFQDSDLEEQYFIEDGEEMDDDCFRDIKPVIQDDDEPAHTETKVGEEPSSTDRKSRRDKLDEDWNRPIPKLKKPDHKGCWSGKGGFAVYWRQKREDAANGKQIKDPKVKANPDDSNSLRIAENPQVVCLNKAGKPKLLPGNKSPKANKASNTESDTKAVDDDDASQKHKSIDEFQDSDSDVEEQYIGDSEEIDDDGFRDIKPLIHDVSVTGVRDSQQNTSAYDEDPDVADTSKKLEQNMLTGFEISVSTSVANSIPNYVDGNPVQNSSTSVDATASTSVIQSTNLKISDAGSSHSQNSTTSIQQSSPTEKLSVNDDSSQNIEASVTIPAGISASSPIKKESNPTHDSSASFEASASKSPSLLIKEEGSPVQISSVDSSRAFSTVQVGTSSSSTKDNVHFAAQPMSYDEKARLRDDILELVERDEHEKISGIANILKLREPNLETEDRFDIDFEVLKTSTIRALEGYVAVALRKKIPKLSFQKTKKSNEG